jgi:hypothetical protein
MEQQIRLEGKLLHVSFHALDRYAERVKCILKPTAVDRERNTSNLRRLLQAHGTLVQTRPEWIGQQPPDDETRAVEAEMWLLVGDSIAFPVVRKRRDFLIVTCMTRGGLSTVRRATRNRIKADKRKARANERAMKSWRGERNQRWR